jgi:ribonuclease HI
LDPELELFTDGSSFVQGGWQKARFAVTTANDITQAEALLQGWSAQPAELWAFVQALQYAKGKLVNIHTDSKHALPPSMCVEKYTKRTADSRGKRG